MQGARQDPETPRQADCAVGVLTVDDDPRFLRLARDVVRATPGFEPVGEAATGEAAVSLAVALRPQLVLMDVRMPGIGGIEAARRIGACGRVAVVLMSSDPQLLAAAPRSSGTVGVVRKERLSPTALREVWVSSGGRLAGHAQARSPARSAAGDSASIVAIP